MRDIFVFGSNLAGRHGKGAALHASQAWDAEYGVGEGLTGNAYAIPTKDEDLKPRKWGDIVASIKTFVLFARAHPEMQFHLTPVGTGLAGFYRQDVADILHSLELPGNIVLTSSWLDEVWWYID